MSVLMWELFIRDMSEMRPKPFRLARRTGSIALDCGNRGIPKPGIAQAVAGNHLTDIFMQYRYVWKKTAFPLFVIMSGMVSATKCMKSLRFLISASRDGAGSWPV